LQYGGASCKLSVWVRTTRKEAVSVKKMQGICSGLLAVILLLALCPAALAAGELSISLTIGEPDMLVNGVPRPIDDGGTAPLIQDGRTLLPVRAVVEAMGGTVAWDGATRSATLSHGSTTVKLQIGSTTAYRNGMAETLDVAPVIINSRTLMPIRYIAESFGADVLWNGDTRTVTILYPAVRPNAGATRLQATEDMGQSYVDRFYFLGDSTTYGLAYYGVVSKNQVWTPASGTLTLDRWSYTALVHPDTGSSLMLPELLALEKPEYLLITLGVNGVSFMEEAYFKQTYTGLVQKIQELSPDTTIILNSIYPVTVGYESKNNGINNSKISTANLWVESVAAATGVHYLDSASVLKNASGALPDAYTNGDGLHLTPEAFGLVLQYLRTHGC